MKVYKYNVQLSFDCLLYATDYVKCFNCIDSSGQMTLKDRYHCYLLFTNEETETEPICKPSQFTPE